MGDFPRDAAVIESRPSTLLINSENFLKKELHFNQASIQLAYPLRRDD
jgi:hypothetical protein